MKERSYLVIFLMAIGTFCSCDKGPDIGPGTFKDTNEIEMETDLLRIVNDHRSRSGLGPLTFDGAAYRYANGHTGYMISKGGLSHDNFEIRASGLRGMWMRKLLGKMWQKVTRRPGTLLKTGIRVPTTGKRWKGILPIPLPV